MLLYADGPRKFRKAYVGIYRLTTTSTMSLAIGERTGQAARTTTCMHKTLALR
jgi:hypothetical protein